MEEDYLEKSTYEWFVEPHDSHTNKVIAERLATLNMLTDPACQELKDKKGNDHTVFIVPGYPFINSLNHSKSNLNLRFKVFGRKNKNNPIEEPIFESRKRINLKPKRKEGGKS